jgi:hypothetical protein
LWQSHKLIGPISIIGPISFFKEKNNLIQEKKKRNRVYRICAYIIFGFFALECISKIPFIQNAIPIWLPTTWVNELFMLEAFAVAWLVKAEAIAKFNDKEEN